MRWLICVLVVGLLGCSKSDGDKAAPSSEAKAPAAVKPEPKPPEKAKKEPPREAAPAVRTDSPLAKVPGAALRDWARAQEIGGKRIQGSKLPKDVAAELVELATPLLEKGRSPKKLRVRWIRAITPAVGDAAPAVAFSFGVPQSYGPPGAKDLTFAVALDDGKSYRVFERIHDASNPEADVNEWAFAKDRDVDGDGLVDTIVTNHSEQGGGGIDKSIGLILLATKGSVAEIQLHQEDGGWEGEGEGYHNHIAPEVACWTKLDGRPAFVHITKAYDSYQEKKPAKWAHTVFAANGVGVIAEVKDRLKLTDKKGAKAWRDLVGGNARPVFVGGDVRNAPNCPGNGQAFLTDNGIYHLQ
jgi:hypothetical protein